MPDALTASLSSRARTLRHETAVRCGQWDCLRLLGRGRWTEVYQARPIDSADDRPADYVIKRLREEYAHEPMPKAALTRDAFVAGKVSHPNLGVVLATHLEAAAPYLVLPYLEGATVRQIIVRASRAPHDVLGRPRFVPLSRALWIVRQAAEGLAHLHQSGWVHSDLNPTNLLVATQGQTTVIDFGLARRLDSVESQTDEIWCGTLAYAAPETFVKDRTLTAATDTYSLGLILFELLTNQPAFEQENTTELISDQRETPLEDVRELRRDIPPKLAVLLRKMTAKEPLRRPCDEELITTLSHLEIESLGNDLP